MNHNLGRLDRILRFLLAFWWLGPWAPQFTAPLANTGIAFIGWVALIESFLGWCALHQWFGINNKDQ